ncbi:hypothetical protein RA267_27620 [Pseudomonas syringae pv. tagetis]|uniref:hypothetical protein n=1 Tax=Pseudomonas syringae group genomosp. 7 TaxID=251699 RepID=UPI0037704AF3
MLVMVWVGGRFGVWVLGLGLSVVGGFEGVQVVVVLWGGCGFGCWWLGGLCCWLCGWCWWLLVWWVGCLWWCLGCFLWVLLFVCCVFGFLFCVWVLVFFVLLFLGPFGGFVFVGVFVLGVGVLGFCCGVGWEWYGPYCLRGG